MNKVTKEEMLKRLDEVIKWFPRYQSPVLQERRDEIDDTIRSFVEKVFEWQDRTTYVLANIALGDAPNGERIYKALALLEEIRDFNFGGK